MPDITIRCSSLPRVITCSQSLKPPDIPIDETTEIGEMGTAVHVAMAQTFQGETPDLEGVAHAHAVDLDQLSFLYYSGKRMWEGYDGAIVPEMVEIGLEAEVSPGIRLIGHPDMLGYCRDDPDVNACIDVKSGLSTRNACEQEMGYIVMATHPEYPPLAKLITFWLREGIVETIDVTAAEMVAWVARLRRTVNNPDRYVTGEHCTYCPRRYECPALRQVTRASMLALTDADANTEMTPARAAMLYPMLQHVEQAADRCRAMIHNIIRESGPQVLPDGNMLCLEERTRETANTVAAWPIIVEELGGQDAALAVTSIGKGQLTRAISAAAPRGEKGARIKAILDRLREAHAINTTTFDVLTVKRIALPEPKEEEA